MAQMSSDEEFEKFLLEQEDENEENESPPDYDALPTSKMATHTVQEFASKIRTKHNKTEKASRITLEERVAEILKQSRQDKIRGERHEPLMADEEEENEFMGSPDTSFEINYGELDLHTRERHAESSFNSDGFILNPTALDSAEQENRYQQHKLEKEDHTLTELGSYKNSVDSWPDYSDDEEFVSEFDQMRDFMSSEVPGIREPDHQQSAMQATRAIEVEFKPKDAMEKPGYEDEEFEDEVDQVSLIRHGLVDEINGSNLQHPQSITIKGQSYVVDEAVGNMKKQNDLFTKEPKNVQSATLVEKDGSHDLIEPKSFDGQIETVHQPNGSTSPEIAAFVSPVQSPPPPPPPDDESVNEAVDSPISGQISQFSMAPQQNTLTTSVVNVMIDGVSNETTKLPEAKDINSVYHNKHDGDIKWSQDSEKHEEKRLMKEQELAFFLRQAKSQIADLEQQLRRKEDNTNAAKAKNNAFNPEHHEAIKSENITRLENEIQSQEQLIQAFQRENEQLMLKMKQIQSETNYDIHLENKRLKLELQHSIQFVDKPVGVPIESVPMQQYHTAVEARLRAESQAAALQEEITSLQHVYRERELEWKSRLNQIEKAMRHMESKYEGIDLDQVVQEHVQVRQLEKQLEFQEKQAAHTAKSLQKKLEWYIENQKLLEDQEQEVDQLKRRIRELESCAGKENEGKVSMRAKEAVHDQGGSYLRSRTDLRRIQKLEKLVKELQSALEKRHPDSVTSLLLAFRQADEKTQTEQVASEYQKKMECLHMELEALRTKYECKVQSFRQQHEKLKLHYEQKLADASRSGCTSTQHSKNVRSKGSHSNEKKPFPDQKKQIARLREFYAAKARDMERKWAAKFESAMASKSKKIDCGSCQARSAAQLGAQDLESAVERKDERLDEIDAQNRVAIEVEKEKVRTLTDQLKQSEMTRQQLAQNFDSLQALRSSVESNQRTVEKAARGTQTKTDFVELERYEILERKLKWQEEERISLKTQHEAECQKLKSKIHRIHKENRKVLVSHAMQVEKLENDITRAQVEKHQIYPELRLMESLAGKVDTLARKYHLRQTELDLMVSRTKSIRELEIAQVQRKYTLVLAEKNAEIQCFEQKLEEMINEMEALRGG